MGIGKSYLLLGFLLLIPAYVSAQITLSGHIKDAKTGQPIPFASASVVRHQVGGLTNNEGYFHFTTTTHHGTLQFAASGYETKNIPFSGSSQFKVALKKKAEVLQEIKISSRRKNYHNKNNPAVALIRQVIDHKEENHLTGYNHVQYKAYEKLRMGIENPGKVIKNNFLLQKYKFIFKNVDTTTIPGKVLLPLYLEENIYEKAYQHSPKKKHSVLLAHKQTALDRKYVNNEGLGQIMRYLYQNVDLYNSNIKILTNSFLSPITSVSPQFYRYFIIDTLVNNQGLKIVHLEFEPRNNYDLLFYGTLYIALNGRYSILGAKMHVSPKANLNWINGVYINLHYNANKQGKYYLKRSRIGIEYGLRNINLGAYGSREVLIENFDTKSPVPDSFFSKPDRYYSSDSLKKSDTFWQQHRPDSFLSEVEKQVYVNIDSLRRIKSFKRLVSWMSFLIGGYKDVGPVAIGPWGTFYSFNPVEGFKLRFGGRTTSDFSHRFFLKGSVAYGFRDKRIKYFGSAAFSFNKKNVFYGYPKHFIRLTTAFDTKIPGRQLQVNDEANLLLSIKRKGNRTYLYNRLYEINYTNELLKNLRFDLNYQWVRQQGIGLLQFVDLDNGQGHLDTVNHLTTENIGLAVRWAPDEQFIVGRSGQRGHLPGKYPVFKFFYNIGFKGPGGGQYSYQKFAIDISKRLNLSVLGIADVNLSGGYLLGKVPYPLLFVPSANQAYDFSTTSYNLMNYLEFVSDQYVAFRVDWHLHGFFLNKIPFLKRLKLREVLGFKAVYGDLRTENRNKLFAFPKNDNGQQITFPFGDMPYMEFNVGIENIFKVLRVDWVHRLNYLHHPNVTENGFRISLHISF